VVSARQENPVWDSHGVVHMRSWRMRTGVCISITGSDRRRLEAITRDRNAPQKYVCRAAIDAIMRRTGTSTSSAGRLVLNVLDGTVIDRNMQRHRHQEIHPLPKRDRNRSPGQQRSPGRPRQLCCPQASEGPRLARPARPLRLSPRLRAPGLMPSRASSPNSPGAD
jgi:hypothetical protein